MDFTTKPAPELVSVDHGKADRPPGETSRAEAPVANLIEGYRSKRMAWIAEAEALARMRDDVRGAAERERMEIITRARERARAVIASARRDLLTLTAQVEASLGPGEPPAQVADLFRGGERRTIPPAPGPSGHGAPGNGGAGRTGRPSEATWTLERKAPDADGSRADLYSLRREK